MPRHTVSSANFRARPSFLHDPTKSQRQHLTDQPALALEHRRLDIDKLFAVVPQQPKLASVPVNDEKLADPNLGIERDLRLRVFTWAANLPEEIRPSAASA
jgi:hypothetical protein